MAKTTKLRKSHRINVTPTTSLEKKSWMNTSSELTEMLGIHLIKKVVPEDKIVLKDGGVFAIPPEYRQALNAYVKWAHEKGLTRILYTTKETNKATLNI